MCFQGKVRGTSTTSGAVSASQSLCFKAKTCLPTAQQSSQVRQFHKEGDQVTSEYELGHFSGNTSEVDEVLYEDGPVTLANPYVREVLLSP